MYIDYSTWEEKELSINSLHLDINNPRLNYSDVVLTQPGIVNFLIEKEKVYDLARDISEKGYFVGEYPILCEENNKKIVLEGNRRTAALKILQDPDKFVSNKRAEILKINIKKNNIDVNKKIKCFIAPNRLVANPIIYNRHKGDSLKRWKTGNQYLFLADMIYRDGLTIDEISNSLGLPIQKTLEPLKAINLFLEGKKLLEEKGITVSVQEFEFTNLERFYKFEEGKEFLGILFNEETGELIIDIPQEEFEKRCIYIFEKILNTKAFSREFNNDNQKKLYIEELTKRNDLFDFNVERRLNSTRTVSSENAQKNNDYKKEINDKPKLEKPKSDGSQFVYINPKEMLFFNDEKIDILFKELSKLDKGKTYSFAILLRTYLEQTLFFYLTKRGLLEKVGLNEKIKKNSIGTSKVKTLIKHIESNHQVQGVIDPEILMGILGFRSSGEFDSNSLGSMLDYTINHVITDLFKNPAELRIQKIFLSSVKNEMDLAVHSHGYIIDKASNIRAWKTLYPLFQKMAEDIYMIEENK